MQRPFSANLRLVLGLVLLLLTLVALRAAPQILHFRSPLLSPMDILRNMPRKETKLLTVGMVLSGLLLAEPLRAHLRRLAPSGAVIAASSAAMSLFLAVFIFHFGNQQFGAWDFSIVVDTAWRQVLGQRPYTDFITPNPPGFNLGAYLAFHLFGVTWNALLYFTMMFAVLTLFWTYWLLRRLHFSAYAALAVCFVLQSLIFLPLCFWWYNDATTSLACIFLLSTLLCARTDSLAPTDASGRAEAAAPAIQDGLAPWLSYTCSLALLALMKPNIAGLLIAGAVVLLFIAVRPKSRMLLWTLAGAALAIAILLLGHVSIPQMIASYRAAAIERGGLSRFGISSYSRPEKWRLLIWTLVLAAPLLPLVPRLRAHAGRLQWRALAALLLPWVALPVCFYGLCTNGEVKDMEMAILVVAVTFASISLRSTGPILRSLLFAMLLSMVATNILFGVQRMRVHGIGEGTFFAFGHPNYPVRDEFFSNLRATPYMANVEHEAGRAARTLPGPLFFGPRLEFDYADLRLPSPLGWPVYYQPGTSFARRDIPRLNELWSSRHFATLVFLGDDRTLYPPELLALIDQQYTRVPGYKDLQVYTRRSP